MGYYTKESLENLRQRIDLVEVLSSHIDLKRAGAAYKALCPFHDEKTPSMIIRQGDTHYHCFGCGAHGDAIQFLMTFLQMSFVEAVESLAERFNVHLEQSSYREGERREDLSPVKDALECATRIYHFILIHTPEGKPALEYLQQRGMDLEFIKRFRIGYSSGISGAFHKMMNEKGYSDEVLIKAGIISITRYGQKREFFSERIMFPVQNAMGGIIGFSARKIREEVFGGKYINTSETPLFKKSQILFGLNFCRRKIAKERKVIIVEGQIDALKLIQSGFDYAVAPLGTAYGEQHTKALMDLGVTKVYLAMDSDAAGKEATAKVGDLLQKKSLDVYCLEMPEGSDPDLIINNQGAQGFQSLMDNSSDYLTFLVNYMAEKHDFKSPAVKSKVVGQIANLIRQWEEPVLIHESLRKLASLTRVPEDVIGVEGVMPKLQIKRAGTVGGAKVDADKILESDLLRWLLLLGGTNNDIVKLAAANLRPEALKDPVCRKIYQTYLQAFQNDEPRDMLSLAISLDDSEGQNFLAEITNKRINNERAQQHLSEVVKKILDRNWMEKREEVRMRIHNGAASDDEIMALVKEFDELKKNPPKLVE
ncbi:MAG: DNA primase [Chlamydiota bacterium]